MKISVITQWYDPETGSAAIPGSIARALRAQGNDVEVITGYPNYPSGRIYPEYRIWFHTKEQRHDILVHRIPLYPSHGTSVTGRILNFLSFMVSSSTIGAFLARRSDAVLVYYTSATVGMAGWFARKVLRRPVVIYIQDIWPDSVTATGMVPARFAPMAERILHAMCNGTYRAVDRILVISPGAKDLLIERGVDCDKIEVVYNWVDEQAFFPFAGTDRVGRDFEIMYAGSLGHVQGLDTAIRALKIARKASPVTLRLIGSGVAEESLRSLAQELGVSEHVKFEGTRPLGEMAQALADADVQLVSLRDDPLFYITMPSKIQAILASGQPLITSAPGDAARLTDESGAGWSCPAGDIDALADRFITAAGTDRETLRALGVRGRNFYEANLSAAVGAAKLDRALRASTVDG